jgi:curved DNA-binding protein CbpA
VSPQPFVDYYEVLQLSPNANGETVERVYRLLAKRYHPDNQTSGDSEKFAELREAFDVLSNPEKRAAYDTHYDQNRRLQWQIFDQESAADNREQDRRVFHGILSLLYIARRRDPRAGGLGAVNLERLLGITEQDLNFAIWYMKQRRWIETMDNGQFAITIEGIDKLGGKDLALPKDRLLPESSLGRDAPAGQRPEPGVAATGTGSQPGLSKLAES